MSETEENFSVVTDPPSEPSGTMDPPKSPPKNLDYVDVINHPKTPPHQTDEISASGVMGQAVSMSMGTEHSVDNTYLSLNDSGTPHQVFQPTPRYFSTPTAPQTLGCSQCQRLQTTMESMQKELMELNHNIFQLHSRLCQVNNYL